MLRKWRAIVSAILVVLLLGGCGSPGQPSAPVETPGPQYLLEKDGEVTLRLSKLLGEGMTVRLKTDEEEVELDAGEARELFQAVDGCAYGMKPQPMPTDAKGYLWAVRVSLGATDEPLFFYFLDMETRATVVVLSDGTQRTLSMDAAQGRALAEAFAGIAAR